MGQNESVRTWVRLGLLLCAYLNCDAVLHPVILIVVPIQHPVAWGKFLANSKSWVEREPIIQLWMLANPAMCADS